MTDQEINIAIAEVNNQEGYWCPQCQSLCVPSEVTFDERHDYPGCGCQVGTRDYCNDLNAMHEAEKQLKNNPVYADELYAVTPVSSREWRFIHATARQRAEAFLRTIGKWKDA